jgi:hypothetical protein
MPWIIAWMSNTDAKNSKKGSKMVPQTTKRVRSTGRLVSPHRRQGDAGSAPSIFEGMFKVDVPRLGMGNARAT